MIIRSALGFATVQNVVESFATGDPQVPSTSCIAINVIANVALVRESYGSYNMYNHQTAHMRNFLPFRISTI